jgi:hypothetical protein
MLIEHSNNDNLKGTFINCPELMYKIEEAEYHGGWAYTEHILGKISAIGSGRDNFFDIINENSKYTSLLTDGSIEQGIQILVTLASKILMAEKATVQTILNGWGGGLELVYYDPGESTFKKIDTVAYILSQGEFNEVGDVGLPIPRLILHYKYHEDLLYITAISIFKCRKQIIDNDIEIISEFEDYVTDLFIVPTILRKDPVRFCEDWNYDFKTSLIGMGYDIRNTKSGRPFYPSAFTLHEEINVSFQHKGQVKFSIRKELTDEFRSHVNEAYPNI